MLVDRAGGQMHMDRAVDRCSWTGADGQMLIDRCWWTDADGQMHMDKAGGQSW